MECPHQPRLSLPQEGVRIVVADDTGLVLRVCCSFLSECPRAKVVGTAADGSQAVAQVRLHRPNLVLLDLEMPAMNGLDAAAQIRREFADVRLAFLTAHDPATVREKCVAAGSQVVMPKIIAREDVCALVQDLFGPCAA